jgi:hypothetical protein
MVSVEIRSPAQEQYDGSWAFEEGGAECGAGSKRCRDASDMV